MKNRKPQGEIIAQYRTLKSKLTKYGLKKSSIPQLHCKPQFPLYDGASRSNSKFTLITLRIVRSESFHTLLNPLRRCVQPSPQTFIRVNLNYDFEVITVYSDII